jgi:phosphatidylinositol alpha 1,6-mannosyltransferase
VKGFGAEVVHVTGPGDVGILGAWVAHSLHLPLIASWHTNLQEYAERRVDRLLGWMPLRLRRNISGAAQRHSMSALVRFYRLARLIMAPNRDMIRILGERTGKPTVSIGHGVDVESFTPDRRSCRKGVFTVGYVGRLTPEKNVRWLAGIERALLERGVQEFRLVLVGAGSEQSWLQANLHHAEFRGILRGPPLAQAFADMDVFVFPSLTDTFGLVILEAMASGVPVVVAPGGGPKYQVRAGQTGFVANTPEDFAECISALKNDPSMHAQMRNAARQHACSASWDSVFTDVYGFYETVLGSPN